MALPEVADIARGVFLRWVLILVSIFSLALVAIGLPAQIVKNYKEKRSGQPLALILIAMGFYASQTAYFAVADDLLPLLSFAVGLLMWGVVLIQYLLYRPKPDPDPDPDPS